jgi:hypothetical protein
MLKWGQPAEDDCIGKGVGFGTSGRVSRCWSRTDTTPHLCCLCACDRQTLCLLLISMVLIYHQGDAPMFTVCHLYLLRSVCGCAAGLCYNTGSNPPGVPTRLLPCLGRLLAGCLTVSYRLHHPGLYCLYAIQRSCSVHLIAAVQAWPRFLL